jgi:opacity protein-like surface antigen
MRSARIWGMAGTVMLAASAANAADAPSPSQPICVPRAQAHLWPGVPLCAEQFSSWYLRGDIGFTNQEVDKIENQLIDLADRVQVINSDFDSAGLFGLGVGYQFNNWLRFDVTGEYRMNSSFNGLDVISSNGGVSTNGYRAKKSEWLLLANAYVDLGTWWCVTPFVGAGVGASRINISGFTDVNTPNHGVAFGPNGSQWNFAWALHAGLAFQASNNLAIELAYRYVSLGDGRAGDARDFLGTNDIHNPVTFRDITSHDLKVGLRFTCCDEPAAPVPVMTKG